MVIAKHWENLIQNKTYGTTTTIATLGTSQTILKTTTNEIDNLKQGQKEQTSVKEQPILDLNNSTKSEDLVRVKRSYFQIFQRH